MHCTAVLMRNAFRCSKRRWTILIKGLRQNEKTTIRNIERDTVLWLLIYSLKQDGERNTRREQRSRSIADLRMRGFQCQIFNASYYKIKADSSKISTIFVVLVITCSSASDLISEDRACRCFIPAFTFRLFTGC